MAMCVGVGRACSIALISLPSLPLDLWAISSHTPGPVFSTVFIPLRKSGIPALCVRMCVCVCVCVCVCACVCVHDGMCGMH